MKKDISKYEPEKGVLIMIYRNSWLGRYIEKTFAPKQESMYCSELIEKVFK